MPDGTATLAGADAPYEDMQASLLAAQPPTLPERLKPKHEANWSAFYQHLESRLAMLRTWRTSWWMYWAVLAEFFLPRRYKWLVTANRMSRGRPINDAIIDGTGTQAVNVCASGMWTGLTSPARPWFEFGPAIAKQQLTAEDQAWLDETADRVGAVLHKSNFYTAMRQVFEDVTVFGTGPCLIYEDAEDVIRCYVPCAGEYFLASGARLSTESFYREFTYTVAQIVDFARLENCPEVVRNLWERGGGALEQEFVVCNAIEPNFAISGRGKAKQTKIDIISPRFTYREVYWLKGQQTERPLSVRGFFSRPFFAGRWSTVSNDPYGRSPCMDALGDNKQVQTETRRKAEFIEKGVRPSMGADVSLKNEPASILPAQITFMNTANGEKKFFPLFEVDARWLPALTQDIDKVNARIERFLFVDVFMAITRMEGVQPRNELELTKRDMERLQRLGPFITLWENECAGPAIKRVVDIMERRGLLSPMPASLRNVPLKIGYISIMRLAQQAAESIAMKDVFVTAGELSAASKAAGVPDPIRTINLDEALKRYSLRNNFPADLFFTKDQIEQHDQQRAQIQQGQEMMGAMPAAVDAAKTLSDTQVGGGSLLNALLTGETLPQ